MLSAPLGRDPLSDGWRTFAAMPGPHPPTAGPSLSPSRAADFMTCPLLYRFRVIDRLPEKPSPAATRGTVVHAALERLFDLPAAERTPETARGLVEPEWLRLLEAEPELERLFAGSGDAEGVAAQVAEFLGGARDLVDAYFQLEDPRRLEPAERELPVSTALESGLALRGYVDRLDVAPSGDLRVVDYKTGKAPAEGFEGKALFQMRFYALVLWRMHGRVPSMLKLLYLGSGVEVTYTPDERDLRATERKIEALWQAIARAHETGEWRPNPSRLCDWCDHQALCPAWGGTPPPLPDAPAPEAQGPPAP